jgi:hypothetical protein
MGRSVSRTTSSSDGSCFFTVSVNVLNAEPTAAVASRDSSPASGIGFDPAPSPEVCSSAAASVVPRSAPRSNLPPHVRRHLVGLILERRFRRRSRAAEKWRAAGVICERAFLADRSDESSIAACRWESHRCRCGRHNRRTTLPGDLAVIAHMTRGTVPVQNESVAFDDRDEFVIGTLQSRHETGCPNGTS